ncbi:hypothetical protein J7T55_001344 [Diaporthe amygdali]|uniref:uncharacterized protein n=1 Tax=Phomopsis amygdali TaxID=1214568 RepID=UPI0022FEAA66|nr:uncharacterized protein J7T55_001344 [Diaporthe amygdali]KAJ0106820.1 hypothetical protein J7T55_001344 [Diaporthe amygdali]
MLTRVLKLSNWGWDDVTIVGAFAATIGVITGRQLQLQAGMGRDIWTLAPEEITNHLKIFYVFAFIYTITMTLIRASICFIYLRLFPNKKFRRIVWATQAFNVALMITFILAYAFQCTPPSYFWNMWHGESQGKCLKFSNLSWTQSILFIALDLWMLALPFWQVKKLNLPLRKRLDAFVMFGCGIFLTIVSVLRLECMITLTNGHNPTKDLTWLATWSNVEMTVGIIIACLPATRLLMLRYLPSKIAAWHQTSRTARFSLTTPRSSKVGSTATWVSCHSGKRESNLQPPMPMYAGVCSTQVSVTSPGVFNPAQHAAGGPSDTSELERRESELPLVDSAPPVTAGQSSVTDEQARQSTPKLKERRIWVEQHIYVSNDPVTGGPTSVPRGEEDMARFPSIEDA